MHEIALLVAIVRGPSYYDPRRNPERALARRTLVLEQMRERGLIDDARLREQQGPRARRRDGRRAGAPRTTSSFMDLVRRQLRARVRGRGARGTRPQDLHDARSVDSSRAEEALVEELARLQGNRAELEGAVVVTSPHNAEVRALVGGKRDRLRRLQSRARRAAASRIADQAGRSISRRSSPAATRSQRSSTTSRSRRARQRPDLVAAKHRRGDARRGDGRARARGVDEPRDGASRPRGRRRARRAHARASRRGAPEPRSIRRCCSAPSSSRRTRSTQLYNTIANGGFHVPLRAVRAVVDGEGKTLAALFARDRASRGPRAVYALNQGLVQVMERGTGATREAAAAGEAYDGRQDRHVRWPARQLVRGLQQRPPRRDLGGQRRQRERRPHGRHGCRADLGARHAQRRRRPRTICRRPRAPSSSGSTTTPALRRDGVAPTPCTSRYPRAKCRRRRWSAAARGRASPAACANGSGTGSTTRGVTAKFAHATCSRSS